MHDEVTCKTWVINSSLIICKALDRFVFVLEIDAPQHAYRSFHQSSGSQTSVPRSQLYCDVQTGRFAARTGQDCRWTHCTLGDLASTAKIMNSKWVHANFAVNGCLENRSYSQESVSNVQKLLSCVIYAITMKQGWGTYFLLPRTASNVYHRWRAAKSINFILKSYHFLTMRKSEFPWLTI